MAISNFSKELNALLQSEIEWAKENECNITFQLVGAGKPVPNSNPVTYAWPTLSAGSSFPINDPYEVNPLSKERYVKRKMLQAYKSEPIKKELGGGRHELIEFPENIEFNAKSTCTFNPNSDSESKLAVLLFSNANKNWKHRDKSMPPRWERIGFKKPSTIGTQGEVILKGKAIAVISAMNFESLKETGLAFSKIEPNFIYEGKTSDELRADILVWTDRKPQVMLGAIASESIKILVKIKDAIAQQKLFHDTEARCWRFKANSSDSFCEYDITVDGEDALIKFLKSDKAKLAKIADSIKVYENDDFNYAD